MTNRNQHGMSGSTRSTSAGSVTSVSSVNCARVLGPEALQSLTDAHGGHMDIHFVSHVARNATREGDGRCLARHT